MYSSSLRTVSHRGGRILHLWTFFSAIASHKGTYDDKKICVHRVSHRLARAGNMRHRRSSVLMYWKLTDDEIDGSNGPNSPRIRVITSDLTMGLISINSSSAMNSARWKASSASVASVAVDESIVMHEDRIWQSLLTREIRKARGSVLFGRLRLAVLKLPLFVNTRLNEGGTGALLTSKKNQTSSSGHERNFESSERSMALNRALCSWCRNRSNIFAPK